jgi:two-component system osmolarity sensor histidine kinase EnvZ
MEGKTVVIDVGDQGPGIPAADIERVKRPFTRLEAARSNVVGAGLGLAIVERIVRSQGGELELLPGTPRGLIARIRLPSA